MTTVQFFLIWYFHTELTDLHELQICVMCIHYTTLLLHCNTNETAKSTVRLKQTVNFYSIKRAMTFVQLSLYVFLLGTSSFLHAPRRLVLSPIIYLSMGQNYVCNSRVFLYRLTFGYSQVTGCVGECWPEIICDLV